MGFLLWIVIHQGNGRRGSCDVFPVVQRGLRGARRFQRGFGVQHGLDIRYLVHRCFDKRDALNYASPFRHWWWNRGRWFLKHRGTARFWFQTQVASRGREHRLVVKRIISGEQGVIHEQAIACLGLAQCLQDFLIQRERSLLRFS